MAIRPWEIDAGKRPLPGATLSPNPFLSTKKDLPPPPPDPAPTNRDSWKPDPYPTVLPSLSAGQLGALAERRRLADERLAQARLSAERGEGIAQANALRARQSEERANKRSLESFMREAAGKSLARAPMVAGRQARVAKEDLGLKYGEISARLSSDMMALQDLVTDAIYRRDVELGLIEQERVNMQADLDRLFPAAYMYGG